MPLTKIKSLGITDGTIVNDDINASAGIASTKLSGITSEVKAWVNFNGTGTPAIRASLNVSSITDVATGVYTVNITTALTDANYSVVITGQATSGVSDNGAAYIANQASADTLTTTSFPIRTGVSNAFGAVDLPTICASVFR
jgi:hypothetical protein